MTWPVLVASADRIGNTLTMVIPAPAARSHLEAVMLDAAFDEFAASIGEPRDRAAFIMIGLLLESDRDRTGYDRECSRRGVLAL